VKLWIATRPWSTFEDECGQESKYKIYLQGFNRQDIGMYVMDELKRHTESKKLQASDAEADDIATRIFEKSFEKSKGGLF
jgi:hypothetical protein